MTTTSMWKPTIMYGFAAKYGQGKPVKETKISLQTTQSQLNKEGCFSFDQSGVKIARYTDQKHNSIMSILAVYLVQWKYTFTSNLKFKMCFYYKQDTGCTRNSALLLFLFSSMYKGLSAREDVNLVKLLLPVNVAPSGLTAIA